MDKQQATEEKLKTVIYDIYTSLFDETASDRRQVFIGQIWDKIVLWWKKYNYHKIDPKEIGEEIFNVIKRLVKDNNETVKNKSEFFYILQKSMENAEKEYIRKYKQGSINIPRDKKRKLKELNELIKTREDSLNRKITNNEKEQCISEFFKKQEYIDLLNLVNIGSISYTGNDKNDEIDALNYIYNPSVDPLNEYINKTDMENVLKAVKLLLDKKQERARDCYRAFFTLYCIENYKDFEKLYSVLDNEILETWRKNGKNPKQYEIYQKYHPNAQKSSAEAMASKNLSEFLNDIETCLKNKNQ